MSIPAIQWFKSIPKFDSAKKQLFTPSQIAVLYYLADLTNDERHYAWPSKGTMSRQLGLNRRSLNRVLHELEAIGYVRIQAARETSSGRWLSSHYYLPWADGSDPWRWWHQRPIDTKGVAPMEFTHEGQLEVDDFEDESEFDDETEEGAGSGSRHPHDTLTTHSLNTHEVPVATTLSHFATTPSHCATTPVA